jgi:hypothetical protein
MKACLLKTRDTLGALQNGGTRKAENHLAFETLLTSIIPDSSDEHGLISFLSDMLEVDRKAIRRCMYRSRKTFGYHGFVSVLHLPRKIRSVPHSERAHVHVREPTQSAHPQVYFDCVWPTGCA